MKINYELLVKKYKQEGDVVWEYNPLRNIKDSTGKIKNFTVDNRESGFNLNLDNPVDIECKHSYDGTVDLIINDDINPPKIVNSRWTRTENNTYKIINREQINQSNIYNEEFLDRETRLFRNVDGVTKIDLYNLSYYGKLKAGNYIIYMKYMDDDYNETDIVAQTGTISIFNGTITKPSSISGGLMDEETDKSILLKLRDLDTSFTYFKLYVYRTTCDSNGILLNYAYKIDKNYEITNSDDLIHITGFEDVVDISVEELNIQYNIVDSVKSQAQVQNMLFFANISKPKDIDSDLQNMSLYIKSKQVNSEESIGYIDPYNYKAQTSDDAYQVEYYSPLNIYYKLGYWPEEIYRFGIVYIYNDDHLSPVYNIRGRDFGLKSNNEKWDYLNRSKDAIPSSMEWVDYSNLSNTKGVFRFSDAYNQIFVGKEIKPLGIQFSFPKEMIYDLRKKKIKGFFFVRQPRIPTILCQGFSVGIDRAGYYPMINYNGDYVVESFKNKKGVLTTQVSSRELSTKNIQSSGLLCVDAYCNKKLQSMFDTSEFKLERIFEQNLSRSNDRRHYYPENIKIQNTEQSTSSLLYIDPEIPQKIHEDKGFSTKAGMQEDLRYSAYFEKSDPGSEDANLVRGIFTAFIGTTSNLTPNNVYNIKIKNYEESFLKEYFEVRMNDNSPYYSISERFCISPKENNVDYDLFGKLDKEYIDLKYIFGGDCFTNTVTTRMHRNFTSSSVPINDVIIDEQSWKENFKGVRNTKDWNKINKADVDAVPIGSWVTYKCLSNFNLGLRCVDPFQIEEQALMGNPRSFYPLQGISVKSSNKINESNLMNEGYNALLGVKRNFTFDVIPYSKDMFDTRIMFSNIQVDGAFKNSYKVFQGLSYEDIDRQYGSITKIIPWGVNLFCVFEHGIAIIPVNEKALLQTTEGANIHMYGAGVLQKQVVLISDKIGSTWKDSIVKTQVAIYGVDTDNHKIWRYSNENKLEIISDFKMQRYLHDNIDLNEYEKYTILGVRNVKSHYNAFKNDVMFTYYNKDNIWNICYNEALGKWITRYSWTPYMSENIDHSMFSFDLLKTRVFGLLNTNLNRSNKDSNCSVEYKYFDGEVEDKNILHGTLPVNIDTSIHLNINEPYTYYNIDNIDIKGYYWDNNHQRVKYDILKSSDGNIECNLYNVIVPDYSGDKLSIEKDMYQYYNENVKGKKHSILLKNIDNKYLYVVVDIKYTPYTLANYISETDVFENNNIGSGVFVLGNETKSYSIGLVRDFSDYENNEYTDDYKNALISSIFVHGRSINADEINYFDKNMNNQCLPTKWYDTQHPFEFEVVVNEPKGFHKIFDNLMIVSNNVEPESFEVEITGDVYGFNKKEMYDDPEKNIFVNIPIIPAANVKENKDKENIDYRLQKEVNTRINWDPIENSYSLAIHQDSVNIKDYGRRLGNIYYNEDKWYITLRPIYYKDITGSLKSTRIRDKYAKIRVKYSGENLAIIVALQSLFTLSYV